MCRLILDVDVRFLGHRLFRVQQELLIVLCVEVAMVGLSGFCINDELARFHVVAASSLCRGRRVETHPGGADRHTLVQSPITHHREDFRLSRRGHAASILVGKAGVAASCPVARDVPLGSAIGRVLQPLPELVDPFRGDVRDELSPVQTSSLRATPFRGVPLPLRGALSSL